MLPIEEIDFGKAVDELFAPTDPPKEADLKNTAETPKPNAVESILARLPPEGGRSSMTCAPHRIHS